MDSRRKTSIIWEIPKEKLQTILNESNSIVEVLQKLGYNGFNGNHRTLNKRIKDENFSLNQFKLNSKKWRKEFLQKLRAKGKLIPEKVFIKNSPTSTNSLKRLILRLNLIPYKCANCPNEGIWNNIPLSLNLDHKNGINNDNQFENLRFLCPNCHSQTVTFSGKKRKKYHFCEKCFGHTSGVSKICKNCIERPLKFIVSKEELEDLVINQKITYRSLGKRFGVSDNAIKKRCQKLGIQVPIRKQRV